MGVDAPLLDEDAPLAARPAPSFAAVSAPNPKALGGNITGMESMVLANPSPGLPCSTTNGPGSIEEGLLWWGERLTSLDGSGMEVVATSSSEEDCIVS